MKTTKNIDVEKGTIFNNFLYSSLNEKQDHIYIDGEYLRCIYLSGYPFIASSGWMHNLINFNHNCDISFFTEEISAVLALPKLQRKITELESTKRSMLKDGKIISSEINDPLNSAIELRDKILRGQEKLFQFSAYIAIRAKDLSDLNKITNLLEANLASKLFYSKIAYFQQLDCMESILPKLTNKISIKRNLNTSSLALSFPFISSEVSDPNGILYGINKSNSSLVIIDRFNLNNANSITFAQSGSGKSYLSKVEILRQLSEGTQVIVIDPEREYLGLCNSVKGTYVKISAGEESNLNPFEIADGIKEKDFFEHIQELAVIIEELLGGLSLKEKDYIDKALIEIYKSKKTKPSLKILKEKLLLANQDKLAERLDKYISGSLSKLFGESKINLQNRLIVFDIKDLSDNLKQLMMLIISNFLYNKIKYDPKKRLLVIDEGWMLLENPSTAKFISGLARRARKYYLGVSIITQQANDFLNNDYGKAIASQSAMRILMKQDTTSIKGVCEEFALSSFEKNYLLTCNRGDALMLLDQNHVAVEIIASKYEHPLITTDPRELFQ